VSTCSWRSRSQLASQKPKSSVSWPRRFPGFDEKIVSMYAREKRDHVRAGEPAQPR
jgi:hypothetical protein